MLAEAHMVVYLKGVSSTELGFVVDFMYNGEAFVSQEKLELFLNTARELKVKGLLDSDDIEGIKTSYPVKRKHSPRETSFTPTTDKDKDLAIKDKESLEMLPDNYGFNEQTVLKVEIEEEKKKQDELDLEVKKLMENKDGLWKCAVCGKTATRKDNMRNHVETHVKGVSKTCHICNKSFANRASIQQHIYGVHSKLYSCNLCDKLGMNRKSFNQHKHVHDTKEVNKAKSL